MYPHNLAWTMVVVWAAVCMSVGVEAVQAHSHPNSHSHMRQMHAQKHAQGHAHKHHVPKRPPPGASLIQDRTDPKRLPKDNAVNPQLLQDNELIRDREHLKEELPEYMNIETIEKMSDKELDFHYFNMHDFDNNLLLDGLEILAALGHVVGEEDEEDDGKEEGQDDEALKGLSDEEKKAVRNYRYQKWEDSWRFYIDLVDGVMEKNDLDKDGFINWREFLQGRNRPI